MPTKVGYDMQQQYIETALSSDGGSSRSMERRRALKAAIPDDVENRSRDKTAITAKDLMRIVTHDNEIIEVSVEQVERVKMSTYNLAGQAGIGACTTEAFDTNLLPTTLLSIVLSALPYGGRCNIFL